MGSWLMYYFYESHTTTKIEMCVCARVNIKGDTLGEIIQLEFGKIRTKAINCPRSKAINKIFDSVILSLGFF